MEYRVASLRNDPLLKHVGINSAGEEGSTQDDAPGQLFVIASEDDTRVSISSQTNLSTPANAVLNKGEVFLVQTEAPLSNLDIRPRNLAGALVSADKPIAVVSGNSRTAGRIPEATAYRVDAPTTNSARNSLAEWLLPIDRLGKTFVYTPMLTEFPESDELIRIVAVEPGNTQINTSFGGPSINISQGEFFDMPSPVWRPGALPVPFVIYADQPVLVYVVSGTWAEPLLDSAGAGYGGITAWGAAMSLLPPVTDWLTISRFRGFSIPASVDQYVIVAAEENATVLLDGVMLDLEKIGSSGFAWGKFNVGAGDHTLRSIGGTFGGIFYGIRSGYELYRVPGIDAKDQHDRVVQHIAIYEEDLSVAWATPIAGGSIEGDPVPDSVQINSRDFCDSTLVTIDRIAENIWLLGPMTVELESGAINTTMSVDTIAGLGPVVGYRIKLQPVDPSADASATLLVRASGVERRIPFDYAGTMVTLPQRIDFGTGLQVGIESRVTIRMANRKSFTATVIDAAVEDGAQGFSLDDGGNLPRPLLVGQAVSIDVLFAGPAPGGTFRDTLLVFTDCGTYRVPLEAATSGEPPLQPEPTITGYDWGVRDLNSTNDTLSFARNVGTRGYRIRDVEIVRTGNSPFSLVNPLHDQDSVRPASQHEIGIRFAPTLPGIYRDSISLITFDNDTVRAELLGRAVDSSAGFPRLDAEDLQFDSLCVGDRLDTFLVVRNEGTAPTTIRALQVIRSTNAILRFQPPTALPVMLPVGRTLQIPLEIEASGTGRFEVLVGIDSSSGGEGIVVRLRGVAVECEPPALVVSDHDFGTIWMTTEKEGSLIVRNVGRGDVRVLDAQVLNDPESSFSYLDPAIPFLVPEGDSVVVNARFSPPTIGRKDGGILFETEIGNLQANLTGVGKNVVIPAFIRRNYRANPGEEVVIDLELGIPPDSVYPEQITYSVTFTEELLDPLGVVSEEGVGSPMLGVGLISGELYRTPDSLLGEGKLLSLRFLTRLSILESTELPFELEADRPWIEFDERPGLFVKGEICALEHRLFEFTRFGLSIGFPEPNPASEETHFSFEIPFDGETEIVIYDLLGFERLRALDQFLVTGIYEVTIPVQLLPPGTYILRFRSGGFAATRRLDVVR